MNEWEEIKQTIFENKENAYSLYMAMLYLYYYFKMLTEDNVKIDNYKVIRGFNNAFQSSGKEVKS